MTAIWESIKQITVYQLVVALISASTFLAPAYFFVKPIAVSAAGTVINNIMVAQGIDPKQFKDIPKKVEEQGLAQKRIEEDLNTIQIQQKELLEDLTRQFQDLKRTLQAPPQ